jgi:hypothetical protein
MTDEMRLCPECEMEFDWVGIEKDGEFYCCEPCSVGDPCECPQHAHGAMDETEPMPTVVGNPGPI